MYLGSRFYFIVGFRTIQNTKSTFNDSHKHLATPFVPIVFYDIKNVLISLSTLVIITITKIWGKTPRNECTKYAWKLILQPNT